MEKSWFDFRTSAEEYSDDTMFQFSNQRNWRKQFRAEDVCLYTFNGKHHSKPSKSTVFVHVVSLVWSGLCHLPFPSFFHGSPKNHGLSKFGRWGKPPGSVGCSGRSPRKTPCIRSWSHVRNQRPWSWLQDDLRQDYFPVSMDGLVMILPKRNQWMEGYVATVGGCIMIDWKKTKVFNKSDMKLDDLFFFTMFYR